MVFFQAPVCRNWLPSLAPGTSKEGGAKQGGTKSSGPWLPRGWLALWQLILGVDGNKSLCGTQSPMTVDTVWLAEHHSGLSSKPKPSRACSVCGPHGKQKNTKKGSFFLPRCKDEDGGPGEGFQTVPQMLHNSINLLHFSFFSSQRMSQNQEIS